MWVLNDAPPNFAEELAKCQRGYLPLDYINVPFTIISQGSIESLISTPVTMRTNPTVAGLEIRDENGVPQTGFIFGAYFSSNGIKVIANKSNHGLTGGYLACLGNSFASCDF